MHANIQPHTSRHDRASSCKMQKKQKEKSLNRLKCSKDQKRLCKLMVKNISFLFSCPSHRLFISSHLISDEPSPLRSVISGAFLWSAVLQKRDLKPGRNDDRTDERLVFFLLLCEPQRRAASIGLHRMRI